MKRQHNLQDHTTSTSTAQGAGASSGASSGAPSSRQEGMKQLADLSMPVNTKQMQANIDDVLQDAMRTINSSLQLTSEKVNEARQRLMQEHPALQQAYGDDGKLSDAPQTDTQTLAANEALENTKQTVDAIFQDAQKTVASFEVPAAKEEQDTLMSLDKEPELLERKYQALAQHEQQDYQQAVLTEHDKQQHASQEKQEALNHAAYSMQQTLLERQRAYEQKILGESRSMLEQEAHAAQAQIQAAQAKGEASVKSGVSSIESDLATLKTETAQVSTLVDHDIEESP